MKVSVRITILIAVCLGVVSCSEENKTNNEQIPAEKNVTTENKTSTAVFTSEKAHENLNFAKDQYLKLIDHVENSRHLDLKKACQEQPEMICVPRSEERDAIHMEESAKWTNGFFPGVLWKILSSKSYINSWQAGEEQQLFKAASYYQETLFSEAKRGSTHDLGFILYDSFGEALNYDGLDGEVRKTYINALEVGRATLATRYSEDVGLIRSWDWLPRMRIATIENGEKVADLYTLSDPWTYPVIVDNMMNLEYLLASENPQYHHIAFNHAKNTSINHYFYDDKDTEQKYPLSFHVFDYGAKKPGNWQGVGNISAWARGQAWSLYGFVTIVEAMDNAKVDLAQYADFKTHLQRLYGSVEHLLQDGVVPYWDFFAARENAYEYAENISKETAVFSGILGLCSQFVESHLKPYNGYRPMTLDAGMLSEESLTRLEGKFNWQGEQIIQGEKLLPCGTKPYPESHHKIPRDTSAAAIFASALYRYAAFTKDSDEKAKFAALADKIMAELTNKYRTDRKETGRKHSLDLGFVLSEATGDMGRGSELDTPIVYGDFYFVEANIRKIEFEKSQQ